MFNSAEKLNLVILIRLYCWNQRKILQLNGLRRLKPPLIQKAPKDISSTPPIFYLNHDLNNLNILVPLSKLAKLLGHRKQIPEFIGIWEKILQVDMINLQGDAPKIVLGPTLDNKDDKIPPLYITLEVHGLHLHSYLFDRGAPHTLMP
jgi:hypothetical protein